VKNQPTYVKFDSLQETKNQKQFEMGVVDAWSHLIYQLHSSI
jgi:hypothetical protein